MRRKPKDADYYGWSVFEKWADENGVERATADWRAWWECWKSAYIAAMNQT